MKPKSKKALIILTGIAAAGTGMYFIFKDDDSPLGEYIRKITGKSDPKMESGTDEIPVIDTTVVTSPTVSPTTNKVITASKYPCSYPIESFPLKIRMKGSDVKSMQTILNTLYKDKIGAQLTVDGCFGPKSETALYKATAKKQLTQDQYLSLAKAAVAADNMFEQAYDAFTGMFN